ncbi:hypothetical protein ABZ540_21700 [Nocardia xishanensis]|uniref:hypothetical protein n=1 Tax=Nocardia xishanensis TaxID=238964 RepID=UPI00340E7C88
MTRGSDGPSDPEYTEKAADDSEDDAEQKKGKSDLMPDTPGMLGDQIDEMSHPDKPTPS